MIKNNSNILLLVNDYLPSIGGAQNVVQNLAQQLKARGHNVCIVVNKSPKTLPKAEVIDGIEVVRIRMGLPRKSLRSYFGFLKQFPVALFVLYKIFKKRKIDIVNVHFVSTGNGLYASIFKMLFKFPLIVSVHGTDVEQLPAQSFIHRWVAKICLNKADIITGCSQHMIEAVRKLTAIADQKYFIIRNGINLSEFSDKSVYQHPTPYIFSIGRFVYKKGFDILIDAFHAFSLEVKDVELIIAGDGEQKEEMEKSIVALKLESKVHLIGYADRATAVQLFNGCDFFVLPSREEALGIVNLEAMAACKAIVATRVGGVPEIIEDQMNGLLVEAENSQALCEAMLILSKSAQMKEDMGRRGASLVEKTFNWNTVADQYLQAYQRAS